MRPIDSSDLFVLADGGGVVLGPVVPLLRQLADAGLIVRAHDQPGIVEAQHPLATWSLRIAVIGRVAGFVVVADADDDLVSLTDGNDLLAS